MGILLPVFNINPENFGIPYIKQEVMIESAGQK